MPVTVVELVLNGVLCLILGHLYALSSNKVLLKSFLLNNLRYVIFRLGSLALALWLLFLLAVDARAGGSSFVKVLWLRHPHIHKGSGPGHLIFTVGVDLSAKLLLAATVLVHVQEAQVLGRRRQAGAFERHGVSLDRRVVLWLVKR